MSLYPDLYARTFRPRPYKPGDRVRHMSLGDGTFMGHATGSAGHPIYRINFDDLGPRDLIAGLTARKLRKLP